MAEIWKQVIICLAIAVVCATGVFARFYLYGELNKQPKSLYLKQVWIGAIFGFLAGIVIGLIIYAQI
jgi:hypothetical protein